MSELDSISAFSVLPAERSCGGYRVVRPGRFLGNVHRFGALSKACKSERYTGEAPGPQSSAWIICSVACLPLSGSKAYQGLAEK